MTQPQEKLLSSEMNLLNNLYLMGLSVIFCFCTYLCSSRPSPQLRYCALLFCVLFLSRLFILRLLCAPVRFVRGDSDCFQKAKRILKYKLLLIVFSCFSSHTRRFFCPLFHLCRSELLSAPATASFYCVGHIGKENHVRYPCILKSRLYVVLQTHSGMAVSACWQCVSLFDPHWGKIHRLAK